MAATIEQVGLVNIKDFKENIVGYELELLCTAHTDNSLVVTLNDTIMKRMGGSFVLGLNSIPGATKPTTDSDLEIADSDGVSLLGTNGTDFIDDTDSRATMLYNSKLSINIQPLVVADNNWVVTLSNNAVASAVFTLKIVCMINR